MNTSNIKKKKSQQKIEKIFIELLQKKEIQDISVSDICKLAKLNRSTFYANYIDIYDLADKLKKDLSQEVINIYSSEREEKNHSYNFLKLFRHIKDNQLFYNTFFKLNYDNNYKQFEDFINYDIFKKLYNNELELDYHITFFMSGLNSIIKKWLKNKCIESPEQINKILIDEYKNKSFGSLSSSVGEVQN